MPLWSNLSMPLRFYDNIKKNYTESITPTCTRFRGIIFQKIDLAVIISWDSTINSIIA